MKYAATDYQYHGKWAVVRGGAYVTGKTPLHRWRWTARLHAWWLNRKTDGRQGE